MESKTKRPSISSPPLPPGEGEEIVPSSVDSISKNLESAVQPPTVSNLPADVGSPFPDSVSSGDEEEEIMPAGLKYLERKRSSSENDEDGELLQYSETFVMSKNFYRILTIFMKYSWQHRLLGAFDGPH